MRPGYSLIELAVALAVVGLVTAMALPGIGALLDGLAVEGAASEVTTALAITRNAAVRRATRARLTIAADSLAMDVRAGHAWVRLATWPGPERRSVGLEVSNPTVTFGPSGIAWGASNTTVVLRTGTHTARVTTSRVGRVRRW